MKYAILGDIHANIDALQAVLADCDKHGVKQFICVGDIVGYNAGPRECLDKIRALCRVAVRGNHDHYCAYDESLAGFHPLAADVVAWTRQQLSPDQLQFLRDLKLVQNGPAFTVVHSTLDTPQMWGYVFDKFEAEANFNYQTSAVCFFGHTHVPLAFEKGGDIQFGLYTKIKLKLGRKYFVNVGSVGQPRDGDPRAAYAMYDDENREITLFRVPYDIDAARQKIRDAGLPERLADRLTIGR
jgi:diadenosine tetraphosphatase ApaH/serine/threonine PP2A family protein phosphatase